MVQYIKTIIAYGASNMGISFAREASRGWRGGEFYRKPRFWLDETGAATVSYVVLTAAAVFMATAVVVSVGSSVKEANANVRKCMRIQSKIMQRDIPYEKQLKRIRNRCKKIR